LERREYYLKERCFNAWNELVMQAREEREREEEERRLKEARKAEKCMSPRIQNLRALNNNNQEDDRQHREQMDEFVMKIKNQHNKIMAHEKNEEEFEGEEDNVDWGEERLDAFVEDGEEQEEDIYSQDEEDEEEYNGDENYEEEENFSDREMSTVRKFMIF